MTINMILTGDVNLMNVADPGVPFAPVADTLRRADLVFSNLECCLYAPPAGHSVSNEGFYADPRAGAALSLGGIQVVGIANNVHYGEAAIRHRCAIGRAGDPAYRRRPGPRGRIRTGGGRTQRHSVRLPATQFGLLADQSRGQPDAPGIAVIRGHTAYHVPVFKTRVGVPPPNRRGLRLRS